MTTSKSPFLSLPPLVLCSAIVVALASGCEKPHTNPGYQGGSILAENQSDTSKVLIDSISRTLNNLPSEIVTELMPPKNVLDDSKSADGQEILAILSPTPGVPNSPFNYLRVPEGNGNFRTQQVESGDIVRYFVKYNQDDLEHGYENVTYLELIVRRLDVNNPQNALILEVGLNGPVDVPHRMEVWRFSDRRMREIRTRLNRYLEKPDTVIGWEPSPDESALVQLTDRLNQWWRNLHDESASWESPPLLDSLPAELVADNSIAQLWQAISLTEAGFEPWESRLLQQSVWLRDISAWAKNNALTDLELAKALFDWTIRNVQLDPPAEDSIVHHPWQALMYGHGTAEDRAWVFAELCRHQNLDVVMLAFEQGEQSSQWWLPAVMGEGELYLFDTRLGLPIQGADSADVATLAQVLADPGILDQLSIEGEESYPYSSESFQGESPPRIVAWLVGSHLQLSKRAAMLQSEIKGEDFVTFTADLQAQVAKLKDIDSVDRVALWPYPLESLLEEQAMSRKARLLAAQRFLIFAQRPKLWKARVLHFQGTKEIPLDQRNDPLAQPNLGHRQATGLYQDRGIRPPERVLQTLDPTKQAIYRISKQDASYWVGLLKASEGNPSVAKHWLEVQTLSADPEGRWSAGARYNLARVYEELGELSKAIELLESDDSPQRLGNLLRARQLRELLAEDEVSPSDETEATATE